MALRSDSEVVEQRSVRERDTSIDVLKGLGIVIVMAGHIDFTPVGGSVVSYLYTFNVAVFFIVAGYTWRPKNDVPLLSFAATRFRQIYLPYVVLFAISLFYGHVIVRYVIGDYVIPFSFTDTAKALIFASDWLNSVPTFNFALWFLPIFLISTLAFQVLQRIPNRWVWGVVVVGLIASALPVQTWLPGRPIVNINVLPVAVGLMACGYLLKRWGVVERLNALSSTALFAATLLVSYYSAGNVSGIGSYLFFPSALASFLVLLKVSGDIRSSRVLQFVGRNSLLFFGIHGLVANTYRATGIPDRMFAEWGGLMSYLVNLAYVFIVTYALVAAWRFLRARIDRRRKPAAA